MSDWIYSAVLIMPVEHRDAINLLGQAMGWGPENYSVPLSPDGNEPITHCGCRSMADVVFPALMQAPPPEAVEAGASELLTLLHVDLRADDDRSNHFEEAAAALGLRRVATPFFGLTEGNLP